MDFSYYDLAAGGERGVARETDQSDLKGRWEVNMDSGEQLLYIGFNQDQTFMTVGTTVGFAIYRLSPLQLVHKEGDIYVDTGNFRIVEMYSNSQLLALVGAGEQPAFSPRCLTMWNSSQRSAICDIYFNDSVLAVQLNRIRIVAATTDAVFIYDTSTMKKQHEIPTARNPLGLMSLSPDHTACFLLYLSSSEMGNFTVYDCFTMQNRREVEAHKTPLAGLTINKAGTMAATVSVKGTIIRVFGLPDGQKLYTFKRGITESRIHHISFAPQQPFLLVSFDSGSLHLFRLSSEYLPLRPASSESWSLTSSLSAAASYLLPEYYQDSFDKPRAFIVIHSGFSAPFKASLLSDSTVFLQATSGQYSVFSVDLASGGSPVLVTQGDIQRLPLGMLKGGAR